MKKYLFLISVVLLFTISISSCKKDTNVDVAGITLSNATATIKPNTTLQLSATFFPENATVKELTWTSSNQNVATVDNTGKVTAIAEGSAIITATHLVNTAVSATCEVTVAWTTLNSVSGEVSGIWEKNSTVNVTGHITVPAGKTLTIEEGVQVLFDDNGVGANHTRIEFMIAGNLYCKGTQSNPVLFSVASAKRTAANTFGGLWGGIIGTKDCSEMLFDNVIIEYTGGDILADSPSAIAGIYTAGADIDCQITTNNPQGKYVVTNCIIRNGRSDGLYFMGGKAIITNNVFQAVGETGAEAINLKAGTKVDAAYNLIFAPNTNGLKLSSSGQDDASGRTQALIRAFNNTIINAGWRRNGVKGGSIYVEKGALVSVFNNLIVNCKFMAQTPKLNQPGPTNGADNNSIIDYNFYASGSQQSPLAQDNPTYLTSYLGYVTANSNYFHDGRSSTPIIDQHSIVSSSAGDAAEDPKFVNYGFNTVALNSYLYNNSWDFHLQSGSPALTGAYSDFTGSFSPYWATSGITVNGTEYKTPLPSARFGAYGTN